ncbi:MAG TPA: hypothetical protein VG053_05515, partial [Solirubrobacteraceae bacterium]|nr:hypothetical protein [Solirubrobacteraceae bacterium]
VGREQSLDVRDDSAGRRPFHEHGARLRGATALLSERGNRCLLVVSDRATADVTMHMCSS